jgi:Reverse transcriptase (RNA-dependent DNA polymerase)
MHPLAFAAKASSLDSPTLLEIQNMPSSEIDQWYEAMDIEIAALHNKKTMIEIPRSQVPQGKQIVKSTWAFCRKRRPSGKVYKLKARFVVRGDLQVLDDTQSTFSPVVSWSTVCLLFVLTVARQLHSITIDFNNAFVQSALPEPIYLELPPGYASPKGTKNVNKVSKSLYGGTNISETY